MRRLVAALSVIAIAVVAAPGCFGRECEPDVIQVPYGEGQTEGDFIDDASWESTPLRTKWLAFPGKRTWKFHIPRWEREGRPFVSMVGYVSAAESPDKVGCEPDCLLGDNWTNGTGFIAEFSQVSPGRFQVTNDSCSPFYLRVVMRAGADADSGTDSGADSGAADAQTE